MKILTTSQMRAADAYTIKHEPIKSVDLMERAAGKLFEFLLPLLDPRKSISIICGHGNNGGDGLVLGRLLINHHYNVELYHVDTGNKSDDYQINEARLQVPPRRATEANFSTSHVLIDAIFGSGLNRPMAGEAAKVIDAMNSSDAWKIAVDIPSGLYSDQSSTGNLVFQAHLTLSFQLPKLAFMMPENAEAVGHWEVLDIGLDQDHITQAESPYNYMDDPVVSLPERTVFAHKGNFGKALIMAGSYGKMGAAVLAARAALRSGVGLLTAYIPKSGYDIMQASVPEAMVLTDSGDKHFTSNPDVENFDAIGFGPGVGIDPQTHFALEETLRRCKSPVVIDADGLNILALQPHYYALIPADSIITPHPGEFERLVGHWQDDFDRLSRQQALARERRLIVVLKGAHTSIALPDGTVYFNATGNSGMATGGSGDVLTGILTGLLAQGMAPAAAARFGVYLHGMAGDLAAQDLTKPGMIAGDIIDYLPAALKEV